jgi:L-ribulose-5-phosphate 3-epimerase
MRTSSSIVPITRRTALRLSLGVGAGFLAAPQLTFGQSAAPRFQIGACDWSIGQTARLSVFEVAKQIGLDGVQLSLNAPADELHLRDKARQTEFLAESKRTGVRVGGLAIGLLNEVPYKSESRTEQWVHDSIDVANALNTKVVLLAFFSKNDLRNDAKGQQAVIDKLKAVAPKAERAGVVLGIESWLSAREHLAIMDAVGSPAVKVYYDVCNASVMGYDILQEIRDLGRDRICEFHFKENGYLLGQGRVNYPAVRKAIADIGYTGWVQIEGAVPTGGQMLPSYQANNQFVRRLLV